MSKMLQHQIRFIIATLIVVAIGGFLWGWVGIALYFETGFVAIAIGFLAGFVASLYFERENGWIYPTLASSFSLLGIFIGKYMLFAYYADELFVMAEKSTFTLSLKAILGLSAKNLKAYMAYSAENFDFYDFIWSFLALITANVNARRVRKYKLGIYRLKQNVNRIIPGSKED